MSRGNRISLKLDKALFVSNKLLLSNVARFVVASLRLSASKGIQHNAVNMYAENCTLLGYYAARSGNILLMGCAETSVRILPLHAA